MNTLIKMFKDKILQSNMRTLRINSIFRYTNLEFLRISWISKKEV